MTLVTQPKILYYPLLLYLKGTFKQKMYILVLSRFQYKIHTIWYF
jgi:hypothetical protein